MEYKDYLNILLTILTIGVVLSGSIGFLTIRNKAKKEAKKISKDVSERVANEYIQQNLPAILESYSFTNSNNLMWKNYRREKMKLNEIFDAINYFKSSAPVDIEGLALALQLKIERQNLADEICGMIKKKDDKYIIIVNQNHAITRQRFTIAHEIGHFIYHRSKIGDGIVDNALYRQTTYNGIVNNDINARDEQQANNFAANVLMPTNLIEQIRNDIGGAYDPIKLAEKLNVSVQAVKIRLEK